MWEIVRGFSCPCLTEYYILPTLLLHHMGRIQNQPFCSFAIIIIITTLIFVLIRMISV